MPINIKVDSLSKTYQVYRKRDGVIASIKGLFHRQYESKTAIKQLSFSVNEGELVGFIGPNGAGKTTTLKILSGLLYPTSGKISVLGFNPWQRDFKFLKQISLIMGQKNQLWWDLPAIESFRLTKEIYGLSDKQYKHNLNNLVDMLDFGDKLDIQVRKLSLGERMKAELVMALLHQPKVLFLDEPTIGLDVVVQQKVRKFIQAYNQEFGGSILLTSHYMADVQALCKRIIIINQGEILFDGAFSKIVKKFSQGKEIQVTLLNHIAKSKLASLPGFVSQSGSIVLFKTSNSQVASLTSQLLAQLPISDINIKDPSLEDIIRDVFIKNKS